MSEQQIKEYLQKYNITSKELLAKHIEELKRNTKPNTKLISELVYVLEDSFFSFSFGEKEIDKRLKLVNYYNEKAIKEYNLDTPLTKASRDYEKSLNNHVSEVIDTKLGEYARTELEPDYRPPFFLDEAVEVNKIFKEKTEKELEFKSLSELYIQGRGKVFVVEAKSREPLVGKNVLIDGERYKVKGVETQGYIEAGKKIGLLVLKTPTEKTEKEENLVFPKDSEIHKEDTTVFVKDNSGFDYLKKGIKESNGKTDYSEIDWDIIDLMAKRFNTNKHKYPKNNMLKPIEETELLFAGFRHLRKMIQPIENDEESFLEHLTAVMCNMQMIYQQRKISNGQ